MINIVIIEDHPVIIDGLKQMFHLSNDGIKIAGDMKSVDELIERKGRYKFDLILLDLYLPGTDAVENVQKIKTAMPDKPIVIYTGEDSEHWRKRMFAAGVRAYITKNALKEEIKFTLLKVSQGDLFIKLKTDLYSPIPTVNSDNQFNQHQLDIIKLLCEDNNQETIGKILGITKSNVEKLLKQIRQIAKTKTNTGLIKYCYEQGILHTSAK
ncbi:MAG: response regulator transcription factor [Bacteroidota bacterium]